VTRAHPRASAPANAGSPHTDALPCCLRAEHPAAPPTCCFTRPNLSRMTPPMNAKLQTLLERQEQIANQIRAEKAKEQKRERKLETRRKVLVGALMLDMMEKDPEMRADILRRL